MDLKKVLAERLLTLRCQTLDSRNSVSRDSKVPTTSLREIETAKINSQFLTVAKLAKYYNVSLDFLAGFTDDPINTGVDYNKIGEIE